MKIVNKILIFILVIIILISFTGCSLKDENKDEKNIEKTKAEMDYIEDSILKILSKYVKGEYTKDDIIEWKYILEDEKSLLDSLDTIILDLLEFKLKEEDIAKLSNEINNLIIVTNDKDEIKLISKIKDIYSLLPEYLSAFEKDENIVNKKRIKYLCISIYDLINQDKWIEAKEEAINLENEYKKIMNNIDTENNMYILIEEFKNTIDLENKELINLKFINMIEKI